jgi:hypothetical protein
MERRFSTAEEMRHALEQAMPSALPTGDAQTGTFIGGLLAENAVARREAVRRTLVRVDAGTPQGGSPAYISSGQSAGSLGALAVDRRGTGSGVSVQTGAGQTLQRVDSKIPLARSRRRYQAALLAAVAIAAAAVFVAAKGLWTPPTLGSRPTATAKSVAAAAAPAAAAPLPAPEEASAPDAGAEPVKETSPPVENPVPAPRSARPARKAKPEAKSTGSDLIAPDYAQ